MDRLGADETSKQGCRHKTFPTAKKDDDKSFEKFSNFLHNLPT